MYRPEFFTGVVFTAALSLGIQIYDFHTHVTTVEFQMSGIYSFEDCIHGYHSNISTSFVVCSQGIVKMLCLRHSRNSVVSILSA